MVHNFAYICDQLNPSVQTYKWVAWIFQQTPQFTDQLQKAQSDYTKDTRIEMLRYIINVDPKVSISFENFDS